MTDYRSLALDFTRQWSFSFASLKSSIMTYFTPDTVWENVGLNRMVGIEGALAFIDGYRDSHGLATIAVEMRHILTSGPIVMTERRDTLLRDDGSIIHTTELVGIFEFHGSRIIGQRDYLSARRASVDPPALGSTGQ